MTVYEQTITKIRHLPEPLAQRVHDFVDFLMLDEDSEIWQLWQQFKDVSASIELDKGDAFSLIEDFDHNQWISNFETE